MILSLPKLTDSPAYKDWTVTKGRLACFQAIRKLFSKVYKIEEKRRTPSGRLQKLLKDATMLQYLAAKQTGSKPQFKFDPISQSSEASLIKDLISLESQTKFLKNNLSELHLSMHARGIKSPIFKPEDAVAETTSQLQSMTLYSPKGQKKS